jgi:hypothetical protein
MNVRNVTKLRAAMEDLLTGVGQVEQVRNNQAYVVGSIDVPYAVNTTAELQALDVTKYTRGRVYSSTTVYTDYVYDEAATSGIAPDSGSGNWVISRAKQSSLSAIEFNTKDDAISGTLPDGSSVELQIGDSIKLRERDSGNQGGGLWTCVDAATIPSPNGIDEIGLSATVVMVLTVQAIMTTKMYGAQHDGSTDDTAAIAKAVADSQTYKTTLISSPGTTIIDVDTGIQVTGNATITWAVDSVWKGSDTTSTVYNILLVSGSNNRLVYPTIDGNKAGHTGAASLTCVNLKVSSTSGANYIIGANTYNSHSHGIVITRADELYMDNVTSTDNVGRGMVVESVDNILSVSGTKTLNNNDAGGLLFKPINSTLALRTVSIAALNTNNNTGPGLELDFDIYPHAGTDNQFDISIFKHQDTGSLQGLYMAPMELGATEVLTGLVSIGFANYSENDLQGIYHRDYSGENAPLVSIGTAQIHNCNNNDSSSDNEAVAVSLHRLNSDAYVNAQGNLQIHNLYVTEDRAITHLFYVIYSEDGKLNNTYKNTYFGLRQIEATDNNAGTTVTLEDASGIIIEDKANLLSRTISVSALMTNRVERELICSDVGSATIIALQNDSSNGEGSLVVRADAGGTAGIRIVPEVGFNIPPQSLTAGKYIESTTQGAYIKLRQDLANNAYIIEGLVGTWTTEP